MGPLLADDSTSTATTFPTGLGFTGIAIALLGRNHPVGIAFGALLWATIERATQTLSLDRHPAGDRQDPAGHFLLAAVIAYEVVRRMRVAAEAT